MNSSTKSLTNIFFQLLHFSKSVFFQIEIWFLVWYVDVCYDIISDPFVLIQMRGTGIHTSYVYNYSVGVKQANYFIQTNFNDQLSLVNTERTCTNYLCLEIEFILWRAWANDMLTTVKMLRLGVEKTMQRKRNDFFFLCRTANNASGCFSSPVQKLLVLLVDRDMS